MEHYRKTRKKYAQHNSNDKKKTACTFYDEAVKAKILEENDTMFVIPNRVSYDMFEGRKVIDHLMVIPKRHVETVVEFTDKEKLDQMNIAGEYEAKGYNVYARGVGSVTRSVKHQHTHMIKLVDKKSKVIIYSRKPHLLIDI